MTSFKKFRQTKVSPSITNIQETNTHKNIQHHSEGWDDITNIQETTVPEHLQHHSEGWDHHSELSDETRDKISAATPGNTFTTFPLNNHAHNDVDADVAEHLTKHNYQVKDYAKGIATIKKHVGDPSRGIPMREKMVEEKIGSVLDKTGASDDVKQSYMNDPARSASKGLTLGGGHHVVITHSPLGISGMSTGTHWRDQSCMNQDGGSLSHKLNDDSENGTHVAYLVHHDDLNALKYGEPDKPIARIAIKPFHEHHDDHESDTIFRPETKTYGSGNTSFENAVGNWATKNYPAKSGVEYSKNSDVYNDSASSHYKATSKEEAEDAVKTNESIVDRPGSSVDKEVIDHALSVGKKHIPTLDGSGGGNAKAWATRSFIKNMSNIGNLNTQHVAALHAMTFPGSEELHSLASKHGDKFSTNAINAYTKDLSPKDFPNKMLMNPKLPSSVVDTLPTNKYSFVRLSMLKPHHYQKIIDNYGNGGSGTHYDLNDHSAHFNKDHIDSLVDQLKPNHSASTFQTISSTAMKSPHFTQDHHDKLIASDPTSIGANKLLKESKFATIKDADKFVHGLTLSDKDSISSLSKNPHISSDTGKAIKDKLVSGAALGTSLENGGNFSIKGYGTAHIPSTIGKHLTPDDHVKLVNSGKAFSIESPPHSEKHLDAISKLITHADGELSNHIDKMKKHHEDNDLDDYDLDDGQDEHGNHLINKLHGHIENYARNLDAHIDNHVDEGGEYIKDHDQHSIAIKHLKKLDDLDNYKTPDNYLGYDRHEHHDDHIADIKDRLKNMETNTEDRENGHGNW